MCEKYKVVDTMNVGVTPAGLAITPDGKYAYVANNNNYSIVDSVTVLDLRTNLPLTTILHPSFNGVYTITINKNKAYVTNSGGTEISIIDICTNKVIKTIQGFDGPSGMVIKRNIGYVNNYGAESPLPSGNGYTVSVVDLKKNIIIDTLAVGSAVNPYTAPAALAISPDKKYVYVINYADGNPGTGNMSIIRTKDNNVNMNAVSGLSGPFGISITPDGTKALITNFGSNNFEPFGTTVSVVDLYKLKIIKTINVGIQPSGVAITSCGDRALISNYNTLYAYVQTTPPPTQYLNLTAGQGTINVINLKTYKVEKTIPVGQSPSYIVISPNDEYAYVSNYTSNTVTVVKL